MQVLQQHVRLLSEVHNLSDPPQHIGSLSHAICRGVHRVARLGDCVHICVQHIKLVSESLNERGQGCEEQVHVGKRDDAGKGGVAWATVRSGTCVSWLRSDALGMRFCSLRFEEGCFGLDIVPILSPSNMMQAMPQEDLKQCCSCLTYLIRE